MTFDVQKAKRLADRLASAQSCVPLANYDLVLLSSGEFITGLEAAIRGA